MSSSQESVSHKCSEVSAPRLTSAVGKTWHPEYFASKDCNEPIKETTSHTQDGKVIACKDCNDPIKSAFNTQDGEPVCSKCFVQLYSGTCAGCQQPILERTIKALGKSWHEDCFVCGGTCHKPLFGTSFYERDGQAYCKSDFGEMFAARCAGCTKPITENAIIALDANWHHGCFRCMKCSNPITDGTFAVEADKPLCSGCAN